MEGNLFRNLVILKYVGVKNRKFTVIHSSKYLYKDQRESPINSKLDAYKFGIPFFADRSINCQVSRIFFFKVFKLLFKESACYVK